MCVCVVFPWRERKKTNSWVLCGREASWSLIPNKQHCNNRSCRRIMLLSGTSSRHQTECEMDFPLVAEWIKVLIMHYRLLPMQHGALSDGAHLLLCMCVYMSLCMCVSLFEKQGEKWCNTVDRVLKVEKREETLAARSACRPIRDHKLLWSGSDVRLSSQLLPPVLKLCELSEYIKPPSNSVRSLTSICQLQYWRKCKFLRNKVKAEPQPDSSADWIICEANIK